MIMVMMTMSIVHCHRVQMGELITAVQQEEEIAQKAKSAAAGDI